MVEQLELEDQNVTFIAELIDLLLFKLIPNWKPCIHIEHLVPPSMAQTPRGCQKNSHSSGNGETAKNSGQDSRSSSCLNSGSLGGSIQATEESCSVVKVDEIMSHVNEFGNQNPTVAEDRVSEMSYISATSTEWNDKKHSFNSYMSTESDPMDFDGHGLKGASREFVAEIQMAAPPDDKHKVMGSSSNGIIPNAMSNKEDNEDTEELRKELEKIELRYQEAVREISKRRHEAILETTRRLSQKSVQSVH